MQNTARSAGPKEEPQGALVRQAVKAALRAGDVQGARIALDAGAGDDGLIDGAPGAGARLRMTPLALAIETFGQLGALEALPPDLDSGGDLATLVDEREAEARDAAAAKPFALALVRELLRLGADPDRRCVWIARRGPPDAGREVPAWHRMFFMPSLNRRKVERSEDDALSIAELLAKHGWGSGSVDADGRTGLHFAAAEGFGRVAALLIDNGWDPASADCYGDTPDHIAAMAGHRELGDVLSRLREVAEISAAAAPAPARAAPNRL